MEILKRLAAKLSINKKGTRFRPIVHTVWTVDHYRKNGELISRTVDHNVVTNEGLDAILDIMFNGATQIGTWYIALFNTDTTPTGATTYAVPVYTESNAKYDGVNRPEYEEAAAASQVTTNTANKARFTFNDAETIYGGALVGGGTDGDTKGDTAGGGTLFAAAQFAAEKVMADEEYLDVTVEITAADA